MRPLLFSATLLVASSIHADSAGPARAGLEAFGQDLERLHARFSQVITSQEGKLLETGSGEVWVSRPGRFRWYYEGEFPELIVADGQHLWMYDPSLEQVIVKKQSVLATNSPLTLLTDLAGLDEQFTVTEMGNNGEVDLLNLDVRDSESEFDRVILGLRNNELVLMAMEDAFGMRTEIRFDDITRNPELDENLFQFEPPPGVDIVGDVTLAEDLPLVR